MAIPSLYFLGAMVVFKVLNAYFHPSKNQENETILQEKSPQNIKENLTFSFKDDNLHLPSPNIDIEDTPLSLKEKKKDDIIRAKQEFKQIFVNNRLFVDETLKKDPNYFMNRVKSQKPKYLFIGCSDSRVPAELILGLQPGELFVQRNIANLVVNTDINVLSVIQYAVDVLKVEHVIVCGHYGCGGVIASMDNSDLGLIENWLRNIRDIYRLHITELEKLPLEERKRKLVELNVQEQCFNLFKVSFVQHSIKRTGFPLIHGLVYELSEGIVKDIGWEPDEYKEKYSKIYSLRKISQTK